ncbi:M48 family metalloprotease [Stappia sp. F7233]|uniref:M48 family metalloprotease n=1 Tax=Stappia albiluteola TaxID=2758565 RepID=A0A839A942_9HYPH|nr:zinc metalloprotease HtpX [Stappia albiluteola]MBA5775861.1 M48 family metalloprotease [Stappia albiluteola]
MDSLTRINPDVQAEYRLRNLLHTLLLAGGSLFLLGLCAYVLAGPPGVLWAAIGGGASLYAATHMSPKMVLGLYRARQLPEDVMPDAHRILRLLSERAGLPRAPDLYLIRSSMMNAFSIGRRDDAAICVTDGLVRGLSGREFIGVMAHEIAHILREDIRVMALSDVVSRMTSVMSFLGLMLALFHAPKLMADGGQAPWLVILILITAPTVGTLLQLALSRTREFEADLTAVEVTGDPEGLAAALMKLEKAHGRMWEAMMLPGARIPDPSILRSHPKTEERVRRILSLRKRPAPLVDVEGWPHITAKSMLPVTGKPRRRMGGLGVWY